MSQPLPSNSGENAHPPQPPAPGAPQPAAPAAPQPAAPAATSPAAPTATHARVGDANGFSVEATLRGISDALSALPERVVNGVREAGQAAAPAPVVNTPNPSNSPATGATATTQPAKRRTFGEWWFGKS